MTPSPATGPWSRGLSERLLSSTIAPGGFGPLPAMIIGFGYGIGAAFILVYIGALVLAAALLVLAAWRGGTAVLIAERDGVAPWQRALAIVLNLVAEGAVIVASAVWVQQNRTDPGPLAVGYLALAGALLLGYARLRIRSSAGIDLPDGPYGIAAREVRLLALVVGMLIGEVYWALVLVAALAHTAVIIHLVRLRVTLTG